MSEAPAVAPTENGAVPAAQDKAVEDVGHKVFVGNIAYSVNDEGLKAFFAPVQSDIISAQVIQRGTRSAGYGFVSLTSAEAAQKAVESLNGKELDGRTIAVEIAKPAEQKDKEKSEKRAKRRPGRRGSKAVPGEVTEAEANGVSEKADDAAAPAEDEAAKPKKKKKNPRNKRKTAKAPAGEGAATTEGETAAPVPATEGAGTAPAPKKRTPKPKRAPKAPRPAGEDPVGEPSQSMLFVANLNFSVDDAGLAALFSEVGITVVSARVIRRRWGQPRKSKGYGFVDVGSQENQQKAIQALNGKQLEGGREISVKIAVNTAHDDEKAEEKEATPEAAAAT